MLLKSDLILNKRTRDGRLVRAYQGPARCFTRGFIDLLYLKHALITDAAPFDIRNIDLADCETDIGDNSSYIDHVTNLLQMSAPPGLSPVYGFVTSEQRDPHLMRQIFGQHLGIAVGVGTTAEAPDDRRLDRMCGHGKRPPDAVDAQFENYTTGDDSDCEIYTNRWYGVAFTPEHTHRINEIRVKIWKEGNPGDLSVEVYGVGTDDDSSLEPMSSPSAANVIASGSIAAASVTHLAAPGDWYTCTLSTPGDVYAGRRYFIILRCIGDSSNSFHWRYDNNDATYKRAIQSNTEAYMVYSTDDGVSWSVGSGDCCMFDERGQCPGDFEIGGCELLDLTFTGVAPHDGEFTLRRYFTNNCGSAIGVNEVGIVSCAPRIRDDLNGRAWLMPYLIARDVLGATVNVLDGEILEVTYKPKITT